MNRNKTLIFIPCYNEAENVEEIFRQIKALGLDSDILFLDDNSPDGTGKIIDRLASVNTNVYTIHRAGKQGIGSAHLDGIRWAFKNNYETLITMDCDLTHSPKDIPAFIASSTQADIVVGSRYMRKDSLVGWNLFRKSLTYLGHFLTRVFLRMPYDASGAFRLFNLRKINKEVFDLISSKGYSFFFESLFILHFNKYTIKEIPIDLPARTYGHSKMKYSDVFVSVKYLGYMWRRKTFNRKSLVNYQGIAPVPGNVNEKKIEEEWDIYWNKKDKSSGIVYDTIATFYRKFIITGILNHFVKKHFSKGQNVLHAGCGSGQVDKDIADYIHITALDISANALKIYKSIHLNKCKVVQGNIFNLPFANESFDGIYNLGVMEHFTEDEIQRILGEFRRVLKAKGRIIIFWPPSFGITVNVLDGTHFVFNKVLKKNIQLHPLEISRIKSKKYALETFDKADLKVIEYYFGARDFYTQSVIVAKKQEQA